MLTIPEGHLEILLRNNRKKEALYSCLYLNYLGSLIRGRDGLVTKSLLQPKGSWIRDLIPLIIYKVFRFGTSHVLIVEAQTSSSCETQTYVMLDTSSSYNQDSGKLQ
ncbi:hypothetical protein AVEN_28948-1 [Araneus ventricosus]|uniref:Uncharacterized protein n=1 Tax=Araneus ventricosus TaxID=182803 RepID=A0A4Y2AL09_ARAVE|nr:hypothetical protein AVEN_28948-1 [Araneus ventricosus]